MKPIVLPCSGQSEHTLDLMADIITFVTEKGCKLKHLEFTNNAGNFKKHSGADFTYDYDGKPIPNTGAEFKYSTDIRGGGGGVIHNN